MLLNHVESRCISATNIAQFLRFHMFFIRCFHRFSYGNVYKYQTHFLGFFVNGPFFMFQQYRGM